MNETRENAYRYLKTYCGCDGLTAELDVYDFQPAMKGHRIDVASIDIVPSGQGEAIDSITATTYFVVDGNIEPLFLTFTVNGTVKYTVSKEAVKILDSELGWFTNTMERFIKDLFGVEDSPMSEMYIDTPSFNVHESLYGTSKEQSDR